jgi:hypothetical protein
MMLTEKRTASYSPEYYQEYIGGSVQVVASLFIVLSTLFVALRYRARYMTSAVLGWDDYLVLVSSLVFVGLCVTSLGM